MFVIHFRLLMLMANDTCKFLPIGFVCVTCRAIIPFSGMVTGKNRKEAVVMVFEFTALACGMATKTGIAVITVAIHTTVFIIHIRLLMFMAICTGEILKGRRIEVAVFAIIPGTVMLTGKNGKKYVVIWEKCRRPIIHFMTLTAIRGK